MKKIQQFAIVLLGAWLAIFQLAQAESEVRIVIDGGSAFARPIAVVPFHWQGDAVAPINVSEIIASDLNNSGMFRTIAKENMPQTPISAYDVKAPLWAKLGVGNVIVGQITPRGKSYAIAFQLVDTIGVSGKAGNVLLQKQYLIPANKLREGVHFVSNNIFQKLTGIRGAFTSKIAYIVQQNTGDKPYQLRIADYDGHNQHIIFQSNEPLMSPAWSMDGKKIAYVTFEKQQSKLILQDLHSGKRTVMAEREGHNGAPAFSPNGEFLAFSSSRDGLLNIYVLDLKSQKITQLTQNAGNNTEPSWSKDSQALVFTSDRNGSPQIYKMDRDGNRVEQLTNQGSNYSGKLMADDNTLVMIKDDHLVKKDLTSGEIEVLTSTFLDETPSLSPNDLMVIYSSTQGLGKVLQLVSIDGHFKARLPSNDGQVKFPAWSSYFN